MQKKDIDWSSLGFGYVKTDKRFVAHYKNGKWDEGQLVEDDTITLNECAGVLQYAQTCFEGLKAYTTKDGRTVCFRPDLNASRIADSCRGLQIPVIPEEMFLRAVKEVVKANEAWVPPFGSGATLYIRPYVFGVNPVIGVKPADEYEFRMFCTPVGPFSRAAQSLSLSVYLTLTVPHLTVQVILKQVLTMLCHFITLLMLMSMALTKICISTLQQEQRLRKQAALTSFL